jgi:hypothetical protein
MVTHFISFEYPTFVNLQLAAFFINYYVILVLIFKRKFIVLALLNQAFNFTLHSNIDFFVANIQQHYFS